MNKMRPSTSKTLYSRGPRCDAPLLRLLLLIGGAVAFFLSLPSSGPAQTTSVAAPAPSPAAPPQAPAPQPGTSLSSATLAPNAAAAGQPSSAAPLSLDNAIIQARNNEPTFAAAVAASKVAALDRSIARAALLPNVTLHNQFVYTEPAHGPTQSVNSGSSTLGGSPRFIANNAVHEYTSQALATETIGITPFLALSRATASAAIAAADLEVSRRGLVSTVVGLYYGALVANSKIAIAQRALNEAQNFTRLTQQREAAREVAHADVVKAQLSEQQRQRDLADAQLARDKAQLELAVLVFPDPHTQFSVPAMPAPVALPTREELQARAYIQNPDLRSAQASLRGAGLDATLAKAAYLPDLSLIYSYGIDSPQLAIHGHDGTRNLGYSATATLDLPVWDWLATRDKIKQKNYLLASAKVALTATQRRIIALIDEYFAEATVARDQLDSLAQSTRLAEESLRLTNLRYKAGEATVLEVVDAQNSFTIAELARQDGIVRYQSALANLQLLTGTL